MAKRDSDYPTIYWVEDGESQVLNWNSLEQFRRRSEDRNVTFAAHIYRDEEDWPTAAVFIGSMDDPAYEMAKLYAQENT